MISLAASTTHLSLHSCAHALALPRNTLYYLQPQLRQWSSQQAPENTPTSAGQPLTYLGSVCGGHSGGTLIDTADDKAFGILVSGPCGCDEDGRARSGFSQNVDKGQDNGVWIANLVDAVAPSKKEA